MRQFFKTIVCLSFLFLIPLSLFTQTNSQSDSSEDVSKALENNRDTVEMIFSLVKKDEKERDKRLKEILEMMRYRIASFRINRAITSIREGKIHVNIPVKGNNIKRIERVLLERGNMGIYRVCENDDCHGKDAIKVYPRFKGDAIEIVGEPILTNYAIKDVKIAELSNKKFLIVFILNPLATRRFEKATAKLLGKRVALIISDRWVNVSLVKNKIASGQIAFPMDYPMEEAMIMLSAISLGAYPEAIQLESVSFVESPFVYPE